MLEPLVKSGKVRALALFATQRSPLLPDRADRRRARLSGPADEQLVRHAGAGRLAAETQASLEKAMLEAMKSPMVAQRLAAGGVVGGTGGKEFAERLAQETAYWGPELKKLGISGE